MNPAGQKSLGLSETTNFVRETINFYVASFDSPQTVQVMSLNNSMLLLCWLQSYYYQENKALFTQICHLHSSHPTSSRRGNKFQNQSIVERPHFGCQRAHRTPPCVDSFLEGKWHNATPSVRTAWKQNFDRTNGGPYCKCHFSTSLLGVSQEEVSITFPLSRLDLNNDTLEIFWKDTPDTNDKGWYAQGRSRFMF